VRRAVVEVVPRLVERDRVGQARLVDDAFGVREQGAVVVFFQRDDVVRDRRESIRVLRPRPDDFRPGRDLDGCDSYPVSRYMGHSSVELTIENYVEENTKDGLPAPDDYNPDEDTEN